MSALAADKNTPDKGVGREFSLKVKGSTTIYKGAMVAIVAGYAVPAGDTSGHIVFGRAEEQVVNSGSDGAKSIKVTTGVFKWGNGGTLAQADVGKALTVVDDNNVALAGDTSNDINAGTFVELDADGGIWAKTPL